MWPEVTYALKHHRNKVTKVITALALDVEKNGSLPKLLPPEGLEFILSQKPIDPRGRDDHNFRAFLEEGSLYALRAVELEWPRTTFVTGTGFAQLAKQIKQLDLKALDPKLERLHAAVTLLRPCLEGFKEANNITVA